LSVFVVLLFVVMVTDKIRKYLLKVTRVGTKNEMLYQVVSGQVGLSVSSYWSPTSGSHQDGRSSMVPFSFILHACTIIIKTVPNSQQQRKIIVTTRSGFSEHFPTTKTQHSIRFLVMYVFIQYRLRYNNTF